MKHRLHLSTTTSALLEVAAVLLALAGIFMLLTGGSTAYEAYSSQLWPKTTAEIVTSRVDTRSGAYGKRTYRSSIKYAYAVDQHKNGEEQFTGERVTIDPFPRSDSRAIAEAGLVKYPKGKFVDVYYNPNRPQRSMLEPSFSLSKLINPAVGLLLLAIALILRVIVRQNNNDEM